MIFRNGEHYYDPTAGEAIRNVTLEQAGVMGKNGEIREIQEGGGRLQAGAEKVAEEAGRHAGPGDEGGD